MSIRRPLPYPAAVLVTAGRRRLFGRSDRVLVALSAGPDSTALLAALAALREAGEIAALSALHVDHGLRPGSAADGECAAETCRRLGVPLTCVRVQVAPGNVQAEARRARYAALRAEAERVAATRIATGHTRTDQAETVLLRLLRGAGARGLAGIPPRRGMLVRPLIDRSRAEGLAYLAALGLAWCEDPTNATDHYARNRVRHHLLPAIARLTPSAERALARSADLLREDERALSARARIAAPGAEVSLERLRAEPAAVRRRVVRRLWRRAAGGEGELGAQHVEAVLGLLRHAAPGRVALPGAVEARCRYGRLEVGSPAAPAVPVTPVVVPGPGRWELLGRAASVRVSARDPALLPWPLELRGRRPGDRFRPEGGVGAKKLKAWLIDRKVPRERRDGLLVLAAGSEVLAIPEMGVRSEVAGARGAGLEVRLEEAGRPTCKRGAGLL